MFSIIAYENNINRRFESYPPRMLHVEDFGGLNRTRYAFVSDKGQALIAHMYSSGKESRGIIVIAHGIDGDGHNSYMDCANYFAQHEYDVFAYDASGNDESRGKGVKKFSKGSSILIMPYLFIRTWNGIFVC